MKLAWRKPDNPTLWIFGFISLIYPGTGERTYSISLGRWTIVLFPKS